MTRSTNARTLWVISGGAEAVPGIQRALAMGLHVVVSDGNPHAPGLRIAGDSVLVSTYDVEATVSAALHYQRTRRPLDGVISIAADVPRTVAAVAAALNLPGVPLQTAALAMDKLAMKQHLQRAGIPVPWFRPVEDVKGLQQVTRQRGFPLVLKPVDSRGARGVLRLTENVDLEWAFEHSRNWSPSGRVMVEEYLEGPQISTESILLQGRGLTPGFIDRNYELLDRFAPFMIENGGEQPTVLTDTQIREAAALAERAALAMGIDNWTAKGDLILTDRGPCVIEMAPRLSGGWFATDQTPLATGVDFLQAAIRLALGESVPPHSLHPQFSRGVAIRYFFPAPGQIRSIHGLEEARALPGVHRLDFFARPGDRAEAVTDHTRRVGFVITVGSNREEALRRAQAVIDSVVIKTDPL